MSIGEGVVVCVACICARNCVCAGEYAGDCVCTGDCDCVGVLVCVEASSPSSSVRSIKAFV